MQAVMDEPQASQKEQKKIGRYLLCGEIAAGGMATVHLGRLRGEVGFSRTVAIKRMHPQYAKEADFVSMFVDEARLVARIRHPNVVPTLDVVASEDELLVVMEYVQGETLSRVLRAARKDAGDVPIRVIAAIVANLLEGLHAAHEAVSEQGEPLGIVHRDVSPQNVIVGVDGGARVLDFGVAKAVGRLQITREGQIKGKLPYMAVEQLHGTAVDRRTDVYAAAVVLWEALAGKRLFTADNEVALFGKVLEGVKEPPSVHNPDVPPALDGVTMRGLDKDAGKRYQTAQDMAIALEEAVGIATPRQVGAWVTKHAKQWLAKKAERVAEMESSPTLTSRPPPPSSLPEEVLDRLSEVSSEVSKVSRSRVAATQTGPDDGQSDSEIPTAVTPFSGVTAPTGTAPAAMGKPPTDPPESEDVDVSFESEHPGSGVIAGLEAAAQAAEGHGEELHTDTQAAIPMAVPVKRRSWSWVLAAVCLLGGAAAALIFFARPSSVGTGETSAAVSTGQPTTVVAPTATATSARTQATQAGTAAPSPEVTLVLRVQPKHAEVEIDGKLIKKRELSLARSEQAKKITFRASGYRTEHREFVPNADGELVIKLVRGRSGSKPGARPADPPPTSQPSGTTAKPPPPTATPTAKPPPTPPPVKTAPPATTTSKKITGPVETEL